MECSGATVAGLHTGRGFGGGGVKGRGNPAGERPGGCCILFWVPTAAPSPPPFPLSPSSPFPLPRPDLPTFLHPSSTLHISISPSLYPLPSFIPSPSTSLLPLPALHISCPPSLSPFLLFFPLPHPFSPLSVPPPPFFSPSPLPLPFSFSPFPISTPNSSLAVEEESCSYSKRDKLFFSHCASASLQLYFPSIFSCMCHFRTLREMAKGRGREEGRGQPSKRSPWDACAPCAGGSGREQLLQTAYLWRGGGR